MGRPGELHLVVEPRSPEELPPLLEPIFYNYYLILFNSPIYDECQRAIVAGVEKVRFVPGCFSLQ